MICPTLKNTKIYAIRSLLNMLYTEMRTLNIAISLVDEISPNVAETILSTAQETTKNICLCAVNLNEDVAAFAQIFEEDKVSSDSKPHISVIA